MCYSIFILPPPPAAPDGPGPQHSDGCHRHAPCRARSKDGSVASSGGQGLRAGDSATTGLRVTVSVTRRNKKSWKPPPPPPLRDMANGFESAGKVLLWFPGKLVICPPGDGGAAVPRPAPDLVRGSQAGATAACAVAGAGGVRRCPGRQAAGQIGRPGSLAGSGSLSVSGRPGPRPDDRPGSPQQTLPNNA